MIISAGAFAYWGANGDGSGSAGTATGTTSLTVKQTSTLEPMYPGDSAQTISGTFDNRNDGPVRVGTVTVSISSVTKADGAPAGTCDASDYTLTDAVMPVHAEVPTGLAQGLWTGAKIKFNNKATLQNACKGAVVSLNYAVG